MKIITNKGDNNVCITLAFYEILDSGDGSGFEFVLHREQIAEIRDVIF